MLELKLIHVSKGDTGKKLSIWPSMPNEFFTIRDRATLMNIIGEITNFLQNIVVHCKPYIILYVIGEWKLINRFYTLAC